MKKTNIKEKIPVVGYLRSAIIDTEGKIDQQASEIEAFASKNGLKVEKKYIDDGFSGAILDRPALRQLRKEAETAVWKMVIISSLDRISRNHTDFVLLKKELRKRGIKIMSLHMIRPSDIL